MSADQFIGKYERVKGHPYHQYFQQHYQTRNINDAPVQHIQSIEISREGDTWTINMRNHQGHIIREFTEFRFQCKKELSHASPGGVASFLVTVESGKLIAVRNTNTVVPNVFGTTHWAWEITRDELLSLIITENGRENSNYSTCTLHFKRV
jgi:hypothetical protein